MLLTFSLHVTAAEDVCLCKEKEWIYIFHLFKEAFSLVYVGFITRFVWDKLHVFIVWQIKPDKSIHLSKEIYISQ